MQSIRWLSDKMTTTLSMQLFQLMRTGAAVLTGVVLAKSGLPLSDIGAWEMLLYIGTTVSFFWVNGLLQGMAPLYTRYEESERKLFIFQVFLVFTGIAVLLFLLLQAAENRWVQLLTGMAQLPHFKLFCWYLLLNLPTFPVEYLYLLRQRPWHIVAWGTLIFGAQLLALYLPIRLGYGLNGGIGCLLVLAALKFLWTIGLVWRYGKWRLDRPMLRLYLFFCAPLMLSNVVSNLMLLFDNWLVGRHYHDAGIFAIYRYGARELPLATALVSALGSSMAPILSRSLPEGLALVKSKSLRLMHWLFPFTLLLMWSSKWLFPMVFSPAFVQSTSLFNIYLLTLAGRVLIPAPIVLSQGDSRSIFVVSLFEMSLKMALGYAFILLWGLEGLAWSVVIAFWVEKLGLMWVLKSRYRISSDDWVPWTWYLFYTALLFAGYAVWGR